MIENKKKDEKNELKEAIKKRVIPGSKTGRFLIPHRQQNVTHDVSSESARFISMNTFFSKVVAENNIFFNKVPSQEI